MRVLTTALIGGWAVLAASNVNAQDSTSLTSPSTSIYKVTPNDPAAIIARAVGDGRTDDSEALQAAIDAAAKPGGGIVFLPKGRYRITRTLFIWPGVRLFGVGETRPIFVLAPKTPGFQKGVGSMIFFTGNRPGATPQPGAYTPPRRVPIPPPTSVPFNPDIADANSGTFYSAMANVDFEIGAGNPAATAVRAHTAQHSYLAHIDFRLGAALAGIYQVGNLGFNLRFYGGRYGILTEKPSPAWSYTLLDSIFDGQRDAAIREHEAGLTLVNVAMRNTPIGIEINRGYGDWLWGKDVRFENVAKAGVIISNEGNSYTQVGFDNAVATRTPTFAKFRDSGKAVAGAAPHYRVKEFTHGLTLSGLNQLGTYQTRMDAGGIDALPARRAAAIRTFPEVTNWTNVRDLGVKGDNNTDDTAAIQRAIDSHKILYFPSGFYKVSDTLRLRPDSILIGLHPDRTQIVLAEDLPAFRGVGAAKGLIESATGGDAVISGIGLFTGGINPRAAGIIWRAGEQSLIDDVKFHGGHGTNLADGSRFHPYNGNQTGDADPKKRWDGQHSSLWVTDGGGGTFNGLWTPNTYAHAGMYISNTSTPGYVYQMSAEHHRRAEIVLDGVRNWEFLAPQTEEEAGEGHHTIALEVRNSSNIVFANFHGYRVTRTRQPAKSSVTLYNSHDIRFRNVHVNAESGFSSCSRNGCDTYLRASKYPYENSIQDVTRGGLVREREFAVLDINKGTSTSPSPSLTKVELVANGFYGLSGGAVDSKGKIYFVDRFFHRIHGWTEEEGLSIASDAPLDPVNLAVDASDNLLVLSSDGPAATVFTMKPGDPGSVKVIAPTPVTTRPGARVALPGSFWVNGEFRDQYDPARDEFNTLAELFARAVTQSNPTEYVSPDGSLVLPEFKVWEQGPPNHMGLRFSPTLDTYGWTGGKIGERVYVANASENRTYSARLGIGGALQDLRVFADRGSESVVEGPDGRVYVANGEIFVYAPDGKLIGNINTPERPLHLVFGGKGKSTLFILSHNSVFRVTP